MNKKVLVAGYLGLEKGLWAQSLPRVGYDGQLQKAPNNLFTKDMVMGGSGYRMLQTLSPLNLPLLFTSVVGSDSTAKNIMYTLKSKNINTTYIREVPGHTPHFVNINSEEGVHQYCFDDCQIPVDNITAIKDSKSLNAEYAIITHGNIHHTKEIFNYSQAYIPNILWIPPLNLYQMGSTLLLHFLRISNVLVINPYRECQICEMLGLGSVGQLLDEGVDLIVNIQDSHTYFQFQILSRTKMPLHQLSSPEESSVWSKLHVEEKFIAGFVHARCQKSSIFESIQMGVIATSIDKSKFINNDSPLLADHINKLYAKHYGS